MFFHSCRNDLRSGCQQDTPEDFEGLALEVRGSVKRRLWRSREALSAGGARDRLDESFHGSRGARMERAQTLEES